jgi:tetratricopeptide (TPR) repeat protein
MHPNVLSTQQLNVPQLTAVSAYSTAVNTEAMNASIERNGQVAHRDAMLQLAGLAAIGIGIRRLNLKVDTLNENVEELRISAIKLLASSHKTNDYLVEVITSLQNIDLTLKSPSETKAREFAMNGFEALKSGWIDDAIKDLNSSIELYRYDALTHGILASALVLSDQHAAAKSEYGLAIKYALSSSATWSELSRACEYGVALVSLGPVYLQSENYSLLEKIYEALLEVPEELNMHFQPIKVIDTPRSATLESLVLAPNSTESSILAFLLYWAISNSDSELASKLLIMNSDFWIDLAKSEEAEFVRDSLELAIERCFSIYVQNMQAFVENTVEVYGRQNSWRFQPFDMTQSDESKQAVHQSIVNRVVSELAEEAKVKCGAINHLLNRIEQKPTSVADRVYFIQTTKEALELASDVIWGLPSRSKHQTFGVYNKSKFRNEELRGQLVLREPHRLQTRLLSLSIAQNLF